MVVYAILAMQIKLAQEQKGERRAHEQYGPVKSTPLRACAENGYWENALTYRLVLCFLSW
jgi:hypothetical protein